jgi:hypothetical protein
MILPSFSSYNKKNIFSQLRQHPQQFTRIQTPDAPCPWTIFVVILRKDKQLAAVACHGGILSLWD